MTDFESVSELVRRTGATYEEARYAYEACGRDMLAAERMLDKRAVSDTYRDPWDDAKRNVREDSRKAFRTAGGLFGKLCRNTVSIKGEKEYFSMPVIAAAVLLIALWELAVPAAVISLFCGISYIFSGPDFAKDYTFGFKTGKNSDVNVSYTEKPDSRKVVNVEPAQYYYDYAQYQHESDKGFFN